MYDFSNARLCNCDRPTQCYKGTGGIYCRMDVMSGLIGWFYDWLEGANSSIKKIDKE